MPSAPPSPATLRLLACVEAFGREEEGAVGHDDWPALASILEREFAVLARLAAETGGAPTTPELQARAEALQARYRRLGERLSAASAEVADEIAELRQAGRRSRDVRQAYGRAAAA